MTLAEIKTGDRVRLTNNVKHATFRNQAGIVKRPVKSRGVVTVRLDDGRIYDALPENVERV